MVLCCDDMSKHRSFSFFGSFEPFDTLAVPFSIGLSPLDISSSIFFHIDDDYPRYLSEKLHLYEHSFSDVYMQEEDTLSSQEEVFGLISDNLGGELSDHFPDRSLPPLARAALHIQDDLILMRRCETGWRLVAGSLCFPSSWNLREKFGKPLETIHSPVPYLSGKMGERIRRIFDSLRPQTPVWRQNWSLKNDDILRHDNNEGSEEIFDFSKPAYIRWEYQTLHKLPISRDILFTIKILIRPLIEVLRSESGDKIYDQLHTYYESMGKHGRDYKRIDSDEFLPWLASQRAIARS